MAGRQKRQKQIVTLDGMDFELESKKIHDRVLSRLTYRFGRGMRFDIYTLANFGALNFKGRACLFKKNRKLAERYFDETSDVGQTFALMKKEAHENAVLESHIQQDILDATK